MLAHGQGFTGKRCRALIRQQAVALLEIRHHAVKFGIAGVNAAIAFENRNARPDIVERYTK